MLSPFWQKSFSAIKQVLPSTIKICIWMLEITVGVSFVVFLLKYFDILPFISGFVAPIFKYLGLPADAALAYLTGYFVNIYSAIAVIFTLGIDARSITILSVMILCSHSMLVETPVLKKTGANPFRIVIIRTFSAFFLAWILNLILAPNTDSSVIVAEQSIAQSSFWIQLWQWFLSVLQLSVKMVVLIFALNIVQKLLTVFGAIEHITNFFKPLLVISGLPIKTAFVWIIANIAGLSYGAAAIIEESQSGNLSKSDIKLVDTHISISHSNFEDLILLSSIGGVWWILLLTRWLFATILVWEQRAERLLLTKLSNKFRKV